MPESVRAENSKLIVDVVVVAAAAVVVDVVAIGTRGGVASLRYRLRRPRRVTFSARPRSTSRRCVTMVICPPPRITSGPVATSATTVGQMKPEISERSGSSRRSGCTRRNPEEIGMRWLYC